MWKFTTVLVIFICSTLENVWPQTLRGVTIQNLPFAELKNGKIEGFVTDLMKEISSINGFNFTLYLTPDGKYGIVVNNTVNGMIGEVHSNRADFAIADITVTDARKEFVDFTEPIIETQITILIHKDNANNINSFSDLADQTDIEYGTLLKGSTYYAFSQSTDPTLQKLYRYMTNNPDNLVRTIRDGINKVNTTRYAFFMEKTSAEYITGTNCDLTHIDDQNNYVPRQYAIALNKGSTYIEQFNSAIRQLKANGKIDRLRNKYWKKCGVLNGVTVISRPFAELINGKMEGFSIDLMNAISNIIGLNFTLELTPDGRYGASHGIGKVPDGMIGEVYRNSADFAVADITVTNPRKRFVDFTEPFFETGLAILIHKNNANNINSFRDLADQTDIKYGVVLGGSTHRFFSQSNDSTISKMYQKMSEDKSVFFNNLSTGLSRVKSSPFAVITETSFAEYVSGVDCQLTYIMDPNHYYPRQYAIAMPKDSIYLEQFNAAIRQLKSKGQIDVFKNRYWKKCEQ